MNAGAAQELRGGRPDTSLEQPVDITCLDPSARTDDRPISQRVHQCARNIAQPAHTIRPPALAEPEAWIGADKPPMHRAQGCAPRHHPKRVTFCSPDTASALNVN